MMRRAYLPLLVLVPLLCACSGLTGVVGSNPVSNPGLGKRTTLIVIARNTSDHIRDGIATELILEKKLGHTLEITRFEFRNENGDRVVAAPAGFVTKPYYECNYDYHPNKNTTFSTIFLCSEDLPVGTRFNNFKLLGYIFGKYEALPTEGDGNKDLAWNTLLATGGLGSNRHRPLTPLLGRARPRLPSFPNPERPVELEAFALADAEAAFKAGVR